MFSPIESMEGMIRIGLAMAECFYRRVSGGVYGFFRKSDKIPILSKCLLEGC